MNRNKQIEEMAKVVCNKDCFMCPAQSPCYVKNFAEHLYKKGYRKASEVAEEIFAEIDSLLEQDEKDFDEGFEGSEHEVENQAYLALTNYVYAIRKIFAELKKKYESEKDK